MLTSRLLTLTSWYQVGVTAVAALVSLQVWDAPRARAVLAAGAFMGANFWLSRWLGARALQADNPKMVYGLALALKHLAALAVLAVLGFVLELDPMGLAMGIATLFVAVPLALSHGLLLSDWSQSGE